MIKVVEECLHHKTQAVFRGRIKKKLSATSITGNKITQEKESMRKEAKFGGSIEGEKNPSVFNPPPYKNNQEYKGGTNDETRDFHTRETSVSRTNNDSCSRNLDAENKNEADEEYIDPPSKKEKQLILNHMKKSEKDNYQKKIY